MKKCYLKNKNRVEFLSIPCTKEDVSMLTGEGSVIISGIISDYDTGAPLKDIPVTYKAFSLRGRMIDTKTAYTSDEGIYTIEAEGYTTEINCLLTASESTGTYSESQIELNIDWNGTSFNQDEMSFIVNNCNFYLKKAAR